MWKYVYTKAQGSTFENGVSPILREMGESSPKS